MNHAEATAEVEGAVKLPVGGDVEVWCASAEAWSEAGAEVVLDAEERERAARFRFAKDRRRYVGRRAAARAVLGRYAGCGAGELRFEREAWGKPRIVRPTGTGLGFSVSGSGKWCLIAVRRGGEVGVDIERVDEGIDLTELARVIGPEGARLMGPKRAEDRARWFYSMWTVREAALKCAGRGLSVGVGAVVVEATRDRVTGCGELAGRAWRVRRFCPAAGYIGAVAIAE